jgi:hypothetical protein
MAAKHVPADSYELLDEWSKYTAPDYVQRLRALHVFDGVLEAEAAAWRIATAINDYGLEDSRTANAMWQMAANVAARADMRWWADPPAVSNAFAAAAAALTALAEADPK